MPKKYTTTVLDAGGRYGLHPTWKPFTGEMSYYLFEPDQLEALRLKEKYAHRSNEITVINKALSDKAEIIEMSFFQNKAMSSSVVRNPVSSLFKGERLSEVEIVEKVKTEAVDIDSFCMNNNLALDFLKLDTEGTEFKILNGAKNEVKNNLLGIRSEVSFDYIFEGMPLFGTLHEFMLENDFYLLNIDYDGKGDYQNEWVRADGRYGILTASDAVWLKRIEFLFKKVRGNNQSIEEQVLKYAAFCFNNHAPDVAIDILLKGRKIHDLDFDKVKGSRLYNFIDISTHKLFYSLKWQPGQVLKNHADVYLQIFKNEMKTVNQFMESTELNPD